MSIRTRRSLLPLVLLLTLCACEESVDPILKSDRVFSLYGTLDMNRDVQYLRVEPIRPTLTAPPAPLDATVISTDLGTGTRTVWTDSVVTFSNGTTGHVFHAPLRMAPGHRYWIEVVRNSDGATAAAQTQLPDTPFATVYPAENRTQKVWWGRLEGHLFRARTWYRFLVSEGAGFQDVVMPYAPYTTDSTAGMRTFQIDLQKDRRTLDTLVDVGHLPLIGMGVELTTLDEAFTPPGGAFDPEVLAQPGAFDNVQGGFGFVGSVGRFGIEWVPDPATAHSSGFVVWGDARRMAGLAPPTGKVFVMPRP